MTVKKELSVFKIIVIHQPTVPIACKCFLERTVTFLVRKYAWYCTTLPAPIPSFSMMHSLWKRSRNLRTRLVPYYNIMIAYYLHSMYHCIDPCQDNSNPCKNGICTANDTTGEYQCHCDVGYEGINCTKEINECLSNPCLNNGSCTV